MDIGDMLMLSTEVGDYLGENFVPGLRGVEWGASRCKVEYDSPDKCQLVKQDCSKASVASDLNAEYIQGFSKVLDIEFHCQQELEGIEALVRVTANGEVVYPDNTDYANFAAGQNIGWQHGR